MLAVPDGGTGEARPIGLLHRRIPSSGEEIPAIGLGTWQAFNEAPSEGDRRRLARVLSLFHGAGGRVIDTSPMYGNAEAVVGRLLPQHGDWFLATKVWTSGREAGIQQMHNSLRLLRRRSIALMQIHNLLDWKTHLPTLRAWKQEGRFRYLGITHYVPGAFASLETVLRAGGIDFVQLPFSPALPEAALRLIPTARDLGVAVLVNRPFEGGGIFRSLAQRRLPDFAPGLAGSWGQLFLKYILAEQGVTCVIPGTGNPVHLADNIKAGLGRLPDAHERKLIEGVARSL